MAPSTTIGLSDLRAQAAACTPVSPGCLAATTVVVGPGSPLVPLALLTTVALLTLGAALPGHGLLGPGASPGYAGTSKAGTDASGGGAAGTPATPVAAVPAVSSCAGPCSTTENISVTILPGRLAISAAPRPLTVRTDGNGVGTGRLGETRVTDLRGASPGWRAPTRRSSGWARSPRCAPVDGFVQLRSEASVG